MFFSLGTVDNRRSEVNIRCTGGPIWRPSKTHLLPNVTYLDSEPEAQHIFYVFFGRFSAQVGPGNVPNGPGLKNATYINEN